ncbi:ABC transporter ATP-binding protein [Anaerococcus hydrogenalis]|uniref:ABC transporter ATP-binding protein n=1 Tax=Anaerococcus hydrogenalis TaxID=33029 RepID=A0A2N6UK65_9FIRM|nr:ABC transporter ATP-binding protein [Anaerococcus hydrogenalis]MDK7694130.1 ABC transporter ATP-binding protein [Anaerococcus hydrogenalis]MDK7695908.1 ABC transporter ATP-binding protein [Anaerococcus hydrogenalis]MDK7707157.1 ABC transporter ATP-binding protein [Anaerococcus hydrogenalis]PMC82185.1 ABC transporter ATP-binding protein [Anaerococcus hydrogenalis]
MNSLKEFFENFKYLMPAVGQYKKNAKISMLATSIETILELVVPTIMALIIDRAVSRKDIKMTFILGGLMIVVSLICMYSGMVATKHASATSSGFGANLRKLAFGKIQKFGFEDLEEFRTSSLITRLTSDIQQIIFSVFLAVRFIIKTVVMALVAVVLSVKVSPRLSLLFLVTLPLLVIAIFFTMSKVIPGFRQFRKEFDKLNLIVQESLANIRVIKSFVRDDFEIKKMAEQNFTMYKLIDKASGAMSYIGPIANVIMFGSMVSIVWFGGNEIISGQIKVGELMSFIMYSMMLLGAFLGISMVLMQMMASSPGVVRIAEVIEHKPYMNNDEKIENLEVKDGSIDFNNVSFKYGKDSDNYALKDINLHIKEGESIGILGSTGSSKSTLVQLLPRLYDIDKGELKIGGLDIKKYDIERLRDAVNIVLQKNTLFSGTIEENIRWGDLDASFEEVEKVAKIACADEFIKERADGYQSVLGQGGTGVSGGQKQRICIARSLLKKPKILILDNSTSAVDTKTESKIVEGINKYSKNLTKIIISQRVSSFKNCDRILVMKDGYIEDIGSHDQVYSRNDFYKKTYDMQEKGSDIDEK